MSEFDLPEMRAMHYRKAAESAFAAKRPQQWAMEPVEAETHAAIMSAQYLGSIEEVRCEFRHEGTPCTGSVSHRGVSCLEQVNVCQSGRAWIEEEIAASKNTCAGCKKHCGDCWRLIPV